jgi:AcrR family transcriptional regulator
VTVDREGMTTRAPRRTQAERRAGTRAKLLDAALECLQERGYGGTTLAEVANRAALTNGAIWRHFPTKAALMAEVALRCEEQLASRATPVDPGLPDAARLAEAVAHLWSRANEPAFQALIELVRAGRADPELKAALQASDQRAADLFYDSLATSLGSEAAAAPHFRRNAKVLGLALYGTALTAHLRTPMAERRLLADMQSHAAKLFLTADQALACG